MILSKAEIHKRMGHILSQSGHVPADLVRNWPDHSSELPESEINGLPPA